MNRKKFITTLFVQRNNGRGQMNMQNYQKFVIPMIDLRASEIKLIKI